VRAGPGGANLTLGDHAWAAEPASSGLPKRALTVSIIDRLAMTSRTPRPREEESHSGFAAAQRDLWTVV
jgi:hypothetical protein